MFRVDSMFPQTVGGIGPITYELLLCRVFGMIGWPGWATAITFVPVRELPPARNRVISTMPTSGIIVFPFMLSTDMVTSRVSPEKFGFKYFGKISHKRILDNFNKLLSPSRDLKTTSPSKTDSDRLNELFDSQNFKPVYTKADDWIFCKTTLECF